MQVEVPADWSAFAEQLEQESWRRLIVLGAADTGKSSFCRYLGERLADLSLLDSDPGQKMVGPPASVTLGAWDEGALRLRRIYFIGDVHPVGSAAALVAAVARLAETPGLGRLVVNTSGLIFGPGIPLKRAKIDALEPDHVVAWRRVRNCGSTDSARRRRQARKARARARQIASPRSWRLSRAFGRCSCQRRWWRNC